MIEHKITKVEQKYVVLKDAVNAVNAYLIAQNVADVNYAINAINIQEKGILEGAYNKMMATLE